MVSLIQKKISLILCTCVDQNAEIDSIVCLVPATHKQKRSKHFYLEEDVICRANYTMQRNQGKQKLTGSNLLFCSCCLLNIGQ